MINARRDARDYGYAVGRNVYLDSASVNIYQRSRAIDLNGIVSECDCFVFRTCPTLLVGDLCPDRTAHLIYGLGCFQKFGSEFRGIGVNKLDGKHIE